MEVVITVDGFTVMVNCCEGPGLLTPFAVYVGVTVIVAVIGEDPVLVALNAPMFPEPDAGSPIAVLLLVQL